MSIILLVTRALVIEEFQMWMEEMQAMEERRDEKRQKTKRMKKRSTCM